MNEKFKEETYTHKFSVKTSGRGVVIKTIDTDRSWKLYVGCCPENQAKRIERRGSHQEQQEKENTFVKQILNEEHMCI